MSVHDDFEDFEGPVRFRSAIAGPLLNSFGDITLVANVTTAQVNAGLVLLPAIASARYRIIGWRMAARGGAATTVTSVYLEDTNTSPVLIATVLAAALTQDTVVSPGAANVTDGVGGMGKPLTVGKGVQIIKNGSDMTVATSVDVTITYAIEKV